jgi:hypothetical protein
LQNAGLQFSIDRFRFQIYIFGMSSTIYFVDLADRIISATYRNLAVGVKVVIVDGASGEHLADPITTIASVAPSGSLRIKLPETIESGAYYLKALSGQDEAAAYSAEFYIR